jgi:hypothetical protein
VRFSFSLSPIRFFFFFFRLWILRLGFHCSADVRSHASFFFLLVRAEQASGSKEVYFDTGSAKIRPKTVAAEESQEKYESRR